MNIVLIIKYKIFTSNPKKRLNYKKLLLLIVIIKI